jgi:UDP-N-acetylmuramoylalanine-D-glutamate ligase
MGGNDKGEALFHDLFNQAQEAINKVYLPGAMAHIQENHGNLYQTILSTDRIKEVWVAIKESESTLNQRLYDPLWVKVDRS